VLAIDAMPDCAIHDSLDRHAAGCSACLATSHAELLAAACAFEARLSQYCDAPDRDRLRAAIAQSTVTR